MWLLTYIVYNYMLYIYTYIQDFQKKYNRNIGIKLIFFICINKGNLKVKQKLYILFIKIQQFVVGLSKYFTMQMHILVPK